MKFLTILISLVSTAAIVACGGSTDATPPYIAVAGTAGICFNPALFVAGNSIQTSSLATYPGLGTAQLGNSTTIDGPSTFNGNAVIKTTETETITPDAALIAIGSPASTSPVSRYFLTDSAVPSLKVYGVESTYAATSDPSVQYISKTTNSPYIETRFSLKPGQSFNQIYTQTTVTKLPNGTSQTTINTYTKNILFNGVAAVTVPAGTFQACQFIETGTVTSSVVSISVPTDTLTQWVGVGNGISIKTVTVSGSGNPITVELTSAAINGAAVTP